MKLSEIFNDVQKWSWITPQGGADIAKISFDDRVFWVYFHSKKDGVSLTFNDDDFSEEITGKGSAFKVFATVGEIVEDYLAKKHLERLYFYAKEVSRQRLYAKLAHMLAQSTGASLEYTDDPHWGRGYILRFE